MKTLLLFQLRSNLYYDFKFINNCKLGDSVAQKLNITPEECSDRSTFLYRQQIEKIQQHMFQKKRQSLLMNQSTTSVNNNSLMDPVNSNKLLTNIDVKGTTTSGT
jgi:hypothetical protein